MRPERELSYLANVTKSSSDSALATFDKGILLLRIGYSFSRLREYEFFLNPRACDDDAVSARSDAPHTLLLLDWVTTPPRYERSTTDDGRSGMSD